MKKIIIFINVFFFLTPLYSQIYIDGAILCVSEKADFFSQMDIENYGQINNNGNIYLSANWNNINEYDNTKGKLILIGTETQIISHNTQNISVLQIDGVGEKMLSSDVYIDSALVLNEGVVKVPLDVILQLNKEAQTFNSSQISYIDGRLFEKGKGYKFFPIGKDGIFMPIELVDIQDDMLIVGFEAFSSNPFPEAETGLQISDERYWEATFLSGTETNSKISVSIGDDFIDEIPENLRVVQAETSSGIYQSIGNDYSNGIEFDGITSDEPLTLNFISLAFASSLNNEFYIPSAFSQVANNIEDQTIKIYGEYLVNEDFHFKVYNKWGEIVFESNSLDYMKNTGWNGINSRTGKTETIGNYTYMLKGKNIEGEEVEKVGSIFIIQ